MLEDFGSAEALVADTQLSSAQVHLAAAYQKVYAAEIGQAIAENRLPPDAFQALYPFIEVVEG